MATPKLTQFEGRDVLQTTVAIRNTGDGLSDALAVDPHEYHQGERVYVVLECDVEKLRFDPIPKTDALSRVHMLKAGNATIVDAALVADALSAQAERIRLAKEAEEGVQRMVLTDDQKAELVVAHREGLHEAAPEFGCEMCDEAKADAEAKDAPAEPTPIGGRKGRTKRT